MTHEQERHLLDRRARVVGGLHSDGGWVGVVLDDGDGLTFGIAFADKT